MMLLLLLLLAAAVFPFCLAFATYKGKIPNGNTVIDDDGVQWGGVGHGRMGGGGPLNSFGKDFAKEGYVWTKLLCEKDSDGDGRTNGEELGDPKCVWKVGDKPKYSCASHPGKKSSVFCKGNSRDNEL